MEVGVSPAISSVVMPNTRDATNVTEGHTVRVCGRQDPVEEAVMDQCNAVKIAIKCKVKSPSRQVRERRRFAAFVERKNNQNVFLYLQVHGNEFPNFWTNCHVSSRN